MGFEVLRGFAAKVGGVVKLSKTAIAFIAKQPAHFTGIMVMVNVEICPG